MKKKIFWLIVGLSVGLLFMGLLRLSSVYSNVLSEFSGLATPGYIITSVVFSILLIRNGLPHKKFGFGESLDLRQIMLAIIAVFFLQLFDVFVDPIIEDILGSSRNLERFSDVQNSFTSLLLLLLMSWTFAAFGEEFTYRIILMRGLSFLFDDSKTGKILAVVIQALMFGLIHAYQGTAGIIGAMVSGLVFGTITVTARWSIWPAAIAHGTNNMFGILELYYG